MYDNKDASMLGHYLAKCYLLEGMLRELHKG